MPIHSLFRVNACFLTPVPIPSFPFCPSFPLLNHSCWGRLCLHPVGPLLPLFPRPRFPPIGLMLFLIPAAVLLETFPNFAKLTYFTIFLNPLFSHFGIGAFKNSFIEPLVSFVFLLFCLPNTVFFVPLRNPKSQTWFCPP